MPRISAYYGIAIYMYFRDHAPPHFHAIYGEHEALVEIESGDIYQGSLPKTALRLVMAWRDQHLAELRENWTRAGQQLPLLPIDPLD